MSPAMSPPGALVGDAASPLLTINGSGAPPDYVAPPRLASTDNRSKSPATYASFFARVHPLIRRSASMASVIARYCSQKIQRHRPPAAW